MSDLEFIAMLCSVPLLIMGIGMVLVSVIKRFDPDYNPTKNKDLK